MAAPSPADITVSFNLVSDPTSLRDRSRVLVHRSTPNLLLCIGFGPEVHPAKVQDNDSRYKPRLPLIVPEQIAKR
jgi:hypothetical protein